MPDTRSLEFQGRSWRYVKRTKTGRIQRKLNTDSLSVARRMRDHFEVTGMWQSEDAIIQKARAFRQQADAEPADTEYPIKLLLPDVLESVEADSGPEAAETFARVYQGETPIITALEAWHGHRRTKLKDRTKADHRTATERFCKWLRARGVDTFLQDVTPEITEAYAEHLETEGIHPRTANKHLNSLRSLWTQSKITPNPWSRISLEEATEEAVKERPFTDDEVRALLDGPGKGDMIPIIKVGLLTGARLEEVFKLRARDIQDGVANFVNSKRKGPVTRRPVPLHDEIRPMLEALAMGKKPDEFLFEGDETGWDGARSMAFSKRFATYRRKCGVDDVVEGQRRSKVNYHSARRWLVTKLEHVECPLIICQRIIGHQTGSLAGDVYSGGGNIKLMAREIAKIVLPT